MSTDYATLCALDAARQMLAASMEGDNSSYIEMILEKVIDQHARTIGEAHLIRDRALAFLGWDQ